MRPLPLVIALVALGGVAQAAPAAKPAPKPAAKPSAMWLGLFDPKVPAHAPWTNDKLTPVAHGGTVRVLTPQTGEAASGDVVVAHALLGKTATGKVDKGTVALTDFAYDERDGDDGVLVFPAGTAVAFVAPSKVDVALIKQTLVRTEALAGVKKAVAAIEVAGVDTDGDGKADIAVTYGCNTWFNGSCQSHGQFVLARRGGRWVEIE